METPAPKIFKGRDIGFSRRNAMKLEVYYTGTRGSEEKLEMWLAPWQWGYTTALKPGQVAGRCHVDQVLRRIEAHGAAAEKIEIAIAQCREARDEDRRLR